MGTPRQHRAGRRPGFTLIELIVVIAIIAFIAALTVVLGPVLLKSDRASRGAQTLQGILFVAKQQSLRDRNPYGVRLLRDGDGQVRRLQYIQQPADFVGGKVTVTSNSVDVTFIGVDLTGGLPDSATWPVQPGDYIQVNTDAFQLIKAVGVTSTGTQNPQALVLASPYSGTTSTTDQYRIDRRPRPVPGEDTILLPDDVIVDFSALDSSQPYNSQTNSRSLMAPDPVTGNLDILFAPSGVILNGGLNGKVILWVRDETQDPTTSKDQSLIVIFTRTGQIGAYAVDISNTSNPSQAYSFTYDARPAGL